MQKTLTVFKKELLELMRNPSTVWVILIPLLILPIFSAGINYIGQDRQAEINISIQSNDHKSQQTFLKFLNQSNADKLVIHNIHSDTPTDLLLCGKIDCILYIEPDSYQFVFNSYSYNSLSLTTKLGECFESFYLQNLGKSGLAVHQFSLTNENNLSVNGTASMTNIIVPFLLIILIFQSTLNFASDLFAGEKERKTLELLLVCGVKRSSIYFGKLFTLLFIALWNVFVSLVSYAFSNVLIKGNTTFGFLQHGHWINNVLAMILTLALLAVLSIVLSSAISLVAKNMRSAQVGNELLLAVPLSILAVSTFGTIQGNSTFLSAIPMLGTIRCFINAFHGTTSLHEIAISSLSSLLFSGLLIFISIKYINSEKVIL